jgi:hypothetical protein
MCQVKRKIWVLIGLIGISLLAISCQAGVEPSDEVAGNTVDGAEANLATTPIPEPTATLAPMPTDTLTPEPSATFTAVPTNTPMPTNTPTPTATADPLADFVEFESESVGFRLMLPQSWAIRTIHEVGPIPEIYFGSDEMIIERRRENNSGAQFAVQRIKSESINPLIGTVLDDDLDLSDPITILNELSLIRGFMNRVGPPFTDSIIVDKPILTVINEMEAASVKVSLVHDDSSILFNGNLYAIPGEDHAILILSWVSEDRQDDLQPILDKMLETFILE